MRSDPLPPSSARPAHEVLIREDSVPPGSKADRTLHRRQTPFLFGMKGP
jgi:hypothetical protein